VSLPLILQNPPLNFYQKFRFTLKNAKKRYSFPYARILLAPAEPHFE